MTNQKRNTGHKEKISDTIDLIPFPDEIAHLKRINNKIDTALQQANANVDRIDKEYMAAKRYMADYRGEIDPHEMFQNELALKQIDRTGAFSVGIWEKLGKLKESPYFARIDFQTSESPVAIKHYIGRFAFSHENELLIIDWRAPFASMFYDYELGLAGYDAPMGRIEGKLTRKRQFKVKNGILEYALESAVNIHDDVLQRELSHTSDEKMKSIIATIQKEQNKIIRNEKAGTIIIQGVAGSGKTAIALHRIAFLLYRFKEKLEARNIMILSPNKVFSDYISSVLPELGEEPIDEQSFMDIAKDYLEGIIAFEADKDPLETEDAKWAARVGFKSTLDFVKQLDQYLQELPAMIFEFGDYSCGHFVATADSIQRRFYGYQDYPIKKRLRLIAKDIHDCFEADNFRGEEIPQPRVILKSLMAMLKVKNSLSLYRGFYQWLGLPEMLELLARKTLEWADVYPFMYLHAVFEGFSESKVIKHLVIDEMQDYTPIQYAVINRLFPCQKTILGDYGQLINPNHQHTIADIQQLYSDVQLVELTKSYRSTYEIIAFAKGIQPVDRLEPVERHGEAPIMVACSDKNDEITKIKQLLDAFLQSGNASLGIILKTNSAALVFHKLLAEDYQIQLISPDSTSFTNGISVTSIQMSKGLEFDEVIVPEVNCDTYQNTNDRSLLYIAATRAMHRLTLLYWGESSRFLLH